MQFIQALTHDEFDSVGGRTIGQWLIPHTGAAAQHTVALVGARDVLVHDGMVPAEQGKPKRQRKGSHNELR